MKIKQIIKSTCIAITTSALLIACGGSGSSGESNSATNIKASPKTTNTESSYKTTKSQFIDAVVSGVKYINEDGTSGFTTSDGYFNYTGGTTKFYVGGIEIGSISKINDDNRTFIQDVVGVDRSNISHPSVLKIAQFLQTIDSDDTTDEIEIGDNYKKFENITAKLQSTDIKDLVSKQGFELKDMSKVKEHLIRVLSKNNITVDTEELRILSTNGDNIINVNDSITIVFDDKLLIESINNKNFLLQDSNAVNIDYSISYNALVKSISIKPTKTLDFNSTYSLTIKTDLKDKASNSLAQEKVISIKTATNVDSKKPTVTLISNTTDLKLSDSIKIEFSEEIKNYKENIFLKDSENTNVELKTFIYDNVSNILTITPLLNLNADSTYTLKISSSLIDMSGLELETDNSDYKEFTLKTIDLADATPLSITKTSLDTEKDGLSVNTKISITFSKEIDKKTLKDNIIITDDVDNLTKHLTFDIDDKTITISHSTDFENAKSYTLKLLTGLKDKNGLALDVLKTYNFTTASVVDKEDPEIIVQSIKKDDEYISINPTFTFTFNEELDQSTLKNSFELIDSKSNKVEINYTYINKVISITPKSNLENSSKYTLILKSTIKDLASNNFDGNTWLAGPQNKKINFTTIADGSDTNKPTLTSPQDLGTVAQDSDIKITFSKELKDIDNNSFILPSGYFFKSYLKKTVLFSSASYVKYDTNYSITLKANISDLSGNTLGSDTIITFKTQAEVDKKKPTISNIIPSNNSKNIKVDSDIVINFSEAIKLESITSNNIQLFQILEPIEGSKTDNLGSNIISQSDFTLTSNKLTINLSNDLDLNSEYKLVIIKNGIKDLSSNYFKGSDSLINADYTSNFSTVKELSTTNCSDGYTEYLDKCYKAFTQKKSHSNALSTCNGGSLVSTSLFNKGGFNIALGNEFASALQLEKDSYWLKNTFSQFGRDNAYLLNVSTFMRDLSTSIKDRETKEQHKFICQKD